MATYTVLNQGPTNWERLDIQTSPGLSLTEARIKTFIAELQSEDILTNTVQIIVTENPTTETYP